MAQAAQAELLDRRTASSNAQAAKQRNKLAASHAARVAERQQQREQANAPDRTACEMNAELAAALTAAAATDGDKAGPLPPLAGKLLRPEGARSAKRKVSARSRSEATAQQKSAMDAIAAHAARVRSATSVPPWVRRIVSPGTCVPGTTPAPFLQAAGVSSPLLIRASLP